MDFCRWVMVTFCISLYVTVSPAKKCIPESLQNCRCLGPTPGGSYVINCRNARLDDIPKGIPTYVTQLILDENNITTIQNNSFTNGLPKLLLLSMRHNNLNHIEPGAFRNMSSLEILDMFDNNLQENDSLPLSVFEPISNSLKVLDIRRNLMNDNITLIDYPIAVRALKKLSVLKLDCIKLKPLPPEYGELESLQRLIFGGGRSDVIHLASTMFDAVSNINISEINLVNLRLGYVNGSTIGKVRSLQILELGHNLNLAPYLSAIIQGLKNTSIQRLRLNNTNIGDNANVLIKNMHGLHIKELLMDQNGIYNIDPILTSSIPKIEILSFGDNYLYERSALIWDIYHLEFLVGLNLSWQQRENSLFSVEKEEIPHLELEKNPMKLVAAKTKQHQRFKRKIHICQTGFSCPVKIPKYMQWVDMSHYGLHLPDVPELVILTNSTLKYVNVAYSGVQFFRKPIFCPTGKFHTTVQIETFDFRFNTIQCFNESMFDYEVTHCKWDSLKHLYFRSNKLGEVEGNICNADKNNTLGFLKPLRNLTVLDLSMNSLGESLKFSDLKTLIRLEMLDVSSNNLKTWTLNIEEMTKLDMVNISNNNLRCLSVYSTRVLDRLQRQRTKPGSVAIDMTGNELSCSCECLDFYKWLKITKVNVVNFRKYQCVFPDGKTWVLNRLDTIVAKLEAECYTTVWFDLWISIVILSYCLIFALTMMYRLRHEIKYMWIRMMMNREKLERLFSSNKYRFKFDAFISCEHRDARVFVYRHLLPNLETKNKGLTAPWLKSTRGDGNSESSISDGVEMSFCVAQRDFIVGEAIIKNVMRAIKGSRKTILIVSKFSLSSNWCEEEMRIAHQESLDRGKNIIICIFMPGVEQDKLPGTIRMITKFVTCLKWPRDERAQKVFWLMLQKAIMDGAQDDII